MPGINPPPFVGVVIAVSTGGPQTMRKFFDTLPSPFPFSIFMVQHSPAWALESMVRNLNRDYDFCVELAADGMKPKINHVYLAPGDVHLTINPINHCLVLTKDAREYYLRPAADPLFRSAALAFGAYCIGMVFTGLGKDGTAGAKVIADAGGTILIQDPKTAVSKFMPQAAIDSGVKHQTVPLNIMARVLTQNTLVLSKKLKASNHLS